MTFIKRIALAVLMLVLVAAPLTTFGAATTATAATAPVYSDYSMMLVGAGSAGQHWSGDQAGGKWEWNTISATEARIFWGDPAKWPPTYNEQFIRQTDSAGDWVRLLGWFDNGTFYIVKTTTEWQAAADCRTGRTVLPTGGAQHYVRWAVPAASYCLYAEGTITEQSSGKVMHFIHQQVYTPPAACGTNAYGLTAPSCITQWESWSDDIATPFKLKLERTATLAQGLGMAFRIRQTFPSVWASDLRWVRRW